MINTNLDDASLQVTSVLGFGVFGKKKCIKHAIYIGNAEYVFAIWDYFRPPNSKSTKLNCVTIQH